MFRISKRYGGALGEVRCSQGTAGAHLRNQTVGLALKYVSQGVEHYRFGKQDVEVSAGEFIVLPQRQKFEAFTDRRISRTQGVCIDLNCDFVLAGIPDLYDQELLFGVPLRVQHFLQIPEIIADFAHQVAPSFTKEDEKINHLRKELWRLVEVIKKLQPGLTGHAKKMSTRRHLMARLFSTKAFVHQYYCKPLSLADMARHAGISIHHFARLFQASFAQSPQQLQCQLRMEAATKLLAEGEQSVTDIAFRLGYADLASFSKQFKKVHQLSPSDWRDFVN